MDTQERIQELIDQGYEVEEVITYRIVDNDRRTCGEGVDEDTAWQEALDNFDRDELRRIKQKLARWNAAVAGKHD